MAALCFPVVCVFHSSFAAEMFDQEKACTINALWMGRDYFTVESPKEKGFCLAWKIETHCPTFSSRGPSTVGGAILSAFT